MKVVKRTARPSFKQITTMANNLYQVYKQHVDITSHTWDKTLYEPRYFSIYIAEEIFYATSFSWKELQNKYFELITKGKRNESKTKK